MAGISTLPSAEVSAMAEPEIPDIKVAEATLVMAKPPRKRPKTALQKPSKRSVMPPCDMSSPASKNKGIASNKKLSSP